MNELQVVSNENPTLIMPSTFDRQLTQLREEIHVCVTQAEALTEIRDLEARTEAIQAGRVLQAVTNDITTFYAPLKKAIDAMKKPILDMEKQDMEKVKSLKEALGRAVEEYDRKQRQAEALVMAHVGVETMSDGLPSPAAIQPALPARDKGKVVRVTWTAEVTNLLALVVACARGQVPLAAVEASQSYLDARAAADKEGFDIPGVIAHKNEKVHFRT